jgi:hypothetical protein
MSCCSEEALKFRDKMKALQDLLNKKPWGSLTLEQKTSLCKPKLFKGEPTWDKKDVQKSLDHIQLHSGIYIENPIDDKDANVKK